MAASEYVARVVTGPFCRLFTRTGYLNTQGRSDTSNMTAHTVHLGGPAAHRSFRLTPPTQVHTEQQPDVVLPRAEVLSVLAGARREDVSMRGCFSAGPSGIQVWDGPWNGPGGRIGSASHLGSIDWSWDSPVEGYVTIYRVLVTASGTATGLSSQDLLDLVLGLSGLRPPSAFLPMPRSAH